MSAVWEAAQDFRVATLAWIQTAKVELEKDPTQNIGGLHQKAAEIRSHANKVRDAVFETMAFNMILRREAAQATWAYEQAKATTAKEPATAEALGKLKTKDEREVALQQLVAAQYQAYVDATNHLEEWDVFLKMVNLVYYSLSNTRDDLQTQVSVIKQQMFNGEVKPNGELSKLSSLSELLGADARNLFAGSFEASTEALADAPSGPTGEVGWGDLD